jgi:hypothetical protein
MANTTHSSIKSLESLWSFIRHPGTCILFFLVNGKKLHSVECPLPSQCINIHVIQHIIWSVDQFAVARTQITIYPVPQTRVSYPIRSKLSEMPLHIPVHQYTCYTAYEMIYRSISSDIDINSHWSSTQTYYSDSIRSMERNYIEWNAPSHSSRLMHMLHNI